MGIISRSSSTSSDNVGRSSSGGPRPWPMPPPGIDLPLLLTVLALVGFGLLMVYSSSFIFAQERTGDGFAFIKKQLLFSLSGVGLMAAICRLDYRKWATSVYPALGLATLLLALVMIPGLGFKAGGAQRWIRLGALSFQPGELAKFAVLLFVARQLDYKQARAGGQTAGILSSFLVPLPALILLLAQPDFGAAVMIVAVVLALMFVGGVPKKYLIAAILLGVIAAAWLALGSPYRRARVASFLDPWQDPAGKGFQIIQSLVGFHNGSFWGVGLGNGREKLFFLPEAHNDFIFAVIGEELGFIGVAAVLLAFVYFVYRGFKIGWTSYRHHGDRFGLYLAVGITLALGLQGFVNMAVAVGMLPTKGLNLPFISYGGSALLVDLCAVGILLSISRGPSRGRGWLHK